jgi:hypothetical protein
MWSNCKRIDLLLRLRNLSSKPRSALRRSLKREITTIVFYPCFYPTSPQRGGKSRKPFDLNSSTCRQNETDLVACGSHQNDDISKRCLLIGGQIRSEPKTIDSRLHDRVAMLHEDFDSFTLRTTKLSKS